LNDVYEGFVVEPELQAKYQKFATFYNAFLASWEKTVTTSWSTRIEPPPLSKDKPSAPTPTRAELNQEIAALSREAGKAFPPITDAVPDTMESVVTIDGKVPSNPTPYLNALRWVNAKMEQSKRDMEDALKGQSGFQDFQSFESFENQTCGQMAQCQQEAERKQTVSLSARLDAFNNAELQRALQTNQQLMEDAKKIQNQAQSGQLLNDLNLPPEPGTSFKKLEGADVLSTMSAEKNEELKANYRTWYDYKSLLSQMRF
jgi:hypothetical protein